VKLSDFLPKKKQNISNEKIPEKVGDLFNIWNSQVEKTSENKTKLSNSDLYIWNYGAKNQDWTIINIVNDIFVNAFRFKASDIHLEPREKIFCVRLRVDGNFIPYKDFPLSQRDSIIARIKIMSSLRIDEHRLPQDGKINYRLFGDKAIDLRVSIMPTIYGEKCVLRILKKDEKPPELMELGIMPYNMVKIKEHLKDNYGMILAVWPTWSGKSTTLFWLLSRFNPEENNISTLEDPVEYRIPWVNHTQIYPAINFSFATWLRSLLRQDPDIIMVGEIRDEETAKLAVEASITGHIVFSTLHTNSAAHTIQRLTNLWVDPLLITSSIRMIISQRLARKLCPKCKIQYKPDEKIEKYIIGKVGKYLKNKEDISLYKANPEWCDSCHHTGYHGRIGFFEILEISEKMEELILKWGSRTQLEIQAIGDGMISIREDGLLKVILWDTSLEEMISVIGTNN
jgi:type IV pilus assembly protein PilB